MGGPQLNSPLRLTPGNEMRGIDKALLDIREPAAKNHATS
jgi:hypothetical protein